MAKLKLATARLVVADPAQWREQDQHSVAASWTTTYADIAFRCWACRTPCVFTAADQKYTYETRKAPVDQQRVLCEACWKQSNAIAYDIATREAQWAESKPALTKDAGFLLDWLQLLACAGKYGHRPNTATIDMLEKLLAK